MKFSGSGSQSNVLQGYTALASSKHYHPESHLRTGKVDDAEEITVTFILRRRADGTPLKDLEYFHQTPAHERKHLSQSAFANMHGAALEELEAVAAFASGNRLKVIGTHPSRRAVVVKGTADELNKAFIIQLQRYSCPLGDYHGHAEPVKLPQNIADMVEVVMGLDSRPVPAKHHAADPANTGILTPMQVAKLYNFPQGAGAGQTIGIFEMPTSEGDPGYTMADVTDTIKLFSQTLVMPAITDVAVDGQTNSGITNAETLLDITVCAAIAPAAKMAVYFAAGKGAQSIIHALQKMIHPDAGDPVPTVISISYGWSPDDDLKYITKAEYGEISQLFQDAAHLGITVLVSSGDTGAMVASPTKAQASYPATDPWVLACGGTTIGSIVADNFTEYVWNDSWIVDGNTCSGATGGGISAFFPLPPYQAGFNVPHGLALGKPGRGIPDIAGNASPASGYPQSVRGQVTNGGGTSAVAPLYAGLIAIVNANIGTSIGYINTALYSLAGSCFRAVANPPANNSFQSVTGYPAGTGWNACTGLGSINGMALQDALQKQFQPAATVAAPTQ